MKESLEKMKEQIEKMRQLFCECLDIHMATMEEAAGVEVVDENFGNIDLDRVAEARGVDWVMQHQSILTSLNRIGECIKHLDDGAPYKAINTH